MSKRLRTLSNFGCPLLALLFVALHVPTEPALGQSRQIFGPEAYIDLAGLWKEPFSISVCWESTDSPFSQEKGWVQEEVKKLIVDNSSIRFQGWKTCSAKDMGIRIRIADEWPRSEVGHQWVRDAKNPKIILSDAATGRPLELPTHMVLNFTFEKEFHECVTLAELGKEHCIRAIAVHEMLHAVGFLHEQLRGDAPDDCKKKYKAMSDFVGISPLEATIHYDPDSIMNYCGNMYKKPIQLSDGDVAVLKSRYTMN